MPELQFPDVKYKISYLEAVKEYQLDGHHYYVPLNIKELEKKFDEYIHQLHEESKGRNLPDGYVPHTTFWLVDGDKFIGRIDIRHELNEWLKNEGGHIGYDIRPSERKKGYGTKILQKGIEKAKELGLNNVLITCDIDNIPSNKVIQKNGGELQDSFKTKNRYIIKTE